MRMNGVERERNARRFAERWTAHGDEKSETEKFWIDLLHDVCGVARPVDVIEFQKPVKLDHVSFIDAYIPSTWGLVEM